MEDSHSVKLYRVNSTVMRWAGFEDIGYVRSSPRHGELIRPFVISACLGLVATLLANSLYGPLTQAVPLLAYAFLVPFFATIPIGLAAIKACGNGTGTGASLSRFIGFVFWPLSNALLVIGDLGELFFAVFMAININLIMLLATPWFRQLAMSGRRVQSWLALITSRLAVILTMTILWWDRGDHGLLLGSLAFFVLVSHVIVYIPFANLSAVLAGRGEDSDEMFERAQNLLLLTLAIWPLWFTDRGGFFLAGSTNPHAWDEE